MWTGEGYGTRSGYYFQKVELVKCCNVYFFLQGQGASQVSVIDFFFLSSHNGTKSKIVFFYFHIFTPLMNKKYQ